MRNKPYLLVSTLTLAVFGLSACANMNQAQCETANWQAIGYEDGVSGVRDSQFSQHRQECAAHGVTANIDDYLKGHNEGSQQYCTHSNGFFLGIKGKNYNRNCPEELVPLFLSGLNDGKQIYSAQRELDAKDDALERLFARIENFELTISDKKNEMIADGLLRSERLEIRQQIESLEIEMLGLIELIPKYQDEQAEAARQYERVQRTFANYF